MAELQATERRQDKSTGDAISDLWEMLQTYAKQQTVDPLRNLGRFLGFGVLGSILVGIGITLLAVGVLRVVQTETDTALTGNWSWVPYMAALVLSAVGAILALKVIKSGKGRKS